MSRHPEVKWAQRSDKLYITIELPDANNPKLKLEPEGKFTFSATAGKDEATYELDFDLYDKVNVEASKINIGLRNIFCIIQKEQKGWWKRLLKNEGKRLSNVKVDWDKWVDEDEEKDDKFGRDMDFGNMDFSKLDMGDDEADNEYEPGNEDEPVDEIEDELPSEETAKKEPVKEEAVAGEPAKE